MHREAAHTLRYSSPSPQRYWETWAALGEDSLLGSSGGWDVTPPEEETKSHLHSSHSICIIICAWPTRADVAKLQLLKLVLHLSCSWAAPRGSCLLFLEAGLWGGRELEASEADPWLCWDTDVRSVSCREHLENHSHFLPINFPQSSPHFELFKICRMPRGLSALQPCEYFCYELQPWDSRPSLC